MNIAEGDKFHVVFPDSRPGVPFRIYPADRFDLPK